MARQMQKDEIYDHESRHPPLPGHKEHSCTDLPWLIIFLASLSGLGYINWYTYRHHDFHKLTHGFNWEGELCGEDGRGSYTYWCKGPDQVLDFKHPVCLENCPEDNQGYTHCFDPQMNRTQNGIPSYETKSMGYFCLPAEADLAQYLWHRLPGVVGQDAQAGDLGDFNVLKIRQILHCIGSAWMLVLASGLVAIVLGYIYLLLLDNFASLVVKVGLALLIIGPLGFGGYFMFCAFIQKKETGWEPDTTVQDESATSTDFSSFIITHDVQWNLILGGCCLLVSAVFSLLACYFVSNLDTAIGCIEASCECLFQEGTLLLEPLISLTFKVATVAAMGTTIIGLVSCGDVSKAGNAGLTRLFEFTTEEKIYLGYAIFMTFWLVELGTATSQYVLAWATQMWYFTPYVRGRKQGVTACAVCKGYLNVMVFHMGTIAVGSLLIATLRCLRLVMWLIAEAAQAEGNVICACIGKACVCLINCSKNFLAFLNKNAYMDVAITSQGFCTSAPRAMGVMAEEIPVIGLLNGAQGIFTIVGVGMIAGIPGGLTFLACKQWDVLSDPDSSHYVALPEWVAGASAAVSAVIAVCFMVIFDTVGDTILYCFVIDQRRVNAFSGFQAPGGFSSEASSEAQDDNEGFFSWIFGGAEKADDETGGGFQELRVHYAPYRLQQLIEDHEHLAQ